MPDFSATVQYIRRDFRNFMGFIDTGSVYAPVQKVDPGPDGKVGTADDAGLVTVYDLTNPGHEFKLFTNPSERVSQLRRVPDHREQALLAQLAGEPLLHLVAHARHGGQPRQHATRAAAARTASARPARSPIRTTPSTLNGDSLFDYTNQVKLDGTYRVPLFGGFNLSAVYRYTTGLAYCQTGDDPRPDAGERDDPHAPVGTLRTDPINNFDFRVEKTFPIGMQSRQAGIYMDIFNVNNQGVIDNGSSTGIIDTSGSSYQNPNHWITPRLVRIGLRFTF